MILIAGDSYSDASDNNSCCRGSVERYSWVDRLSEDFEIRCVGQVGASNYDIVRQVSRERGYSLLVVNLSHPERVSTYPPHPKVEDESDLNFKIAAQFAQRANTICWTPFAGYESIPGILYQPLTEHNELYTESVEYECTKHHFTREGNDIMYRWMKERLNETLVDVVQ